MLGGGAYKLSGGGSDHSRIGPWGTTGLRFTWTRKIDVEVRGEIQQERQVSTLLELFRRCPYAEQPRACRPAQCEARTFAPEPRTFAHAQHRHVILLEKLLDTLLPRFAHVRRRRVRIDVVRIDLERDQPERLERWRLHDRHVIGRPQRRTGHVRPRA